MSDALLFAQVPGFYAEVERSAEPALAGRPVIVGGDPRKRGVVQAATADAVARGVAEGMSMLEALEHCPEARTRPTAMRLYRDVAAKLQACFRRVTDRMEPAGLDAAWLELHDAAGDPEAIGVALRREVEERLGLPLRVGIAPAKFLARLAAEEAGASGVRRVRRAEIADFLAPLPVSRLPGVGPRTAALLAELSLRKAGELASADRELLEARLGNHGLQILDYAAGRDPSRLRPAPHPRSLSQQHTLEQPERDRALLEEELQRLAERLEAALEREGLTARRVSLAVHLAHGRDLTRSRTLDPVRTAGEIARIAAELLARTPAGERPVRRLRLSLHGLARGARDDRQLDLF